jgi:hypothetical protein
MVKRAGEQMFRVNARRIMFVNYWAHVLHESAAMWKLYTSDNHSNCIRSTFQPLWDCLPEKLCYLGEVTYLDYDSEFFDHGNMFDLVLHKRTSFAHEREVVACIDPIQHVFRSPPPRAWLIRKTQAVVQSLDLMKMAVLSQPQ